MECLLRTAWPGHLENQLHVFIDDGRGLREFVVRVKGSVSGRWIRLTDLQL
ncbi:MAG TPA: hypothetical protein PKD86_16795 [Gemmatales bacterium]|nr:hypothetical protein [Gemmatales bacterium]HMP61004.1 hypothetical protein [Gemmatales bacterium]